MGSCCATGQAARWDAGLLSMYLCIENSRIHTSPINNYATQVTISDLGMMTLLSEFGQILVSSLIHSFVVNTNSFVLYLSFVLYPKSNSNRT